MPGTVSISSAPPVSAVHWLFVANYNSYICSTTQTRLRILSWQNLARGQGRLVLRYSGTEPLARVMIEGPELAQIEAMAARLIEAIQADIAKDQNE